LYNWLGATLIYACGGKITNKKVTFFVCPGTELEKQAAPGTCPGPEDRFELGVSIIEPRFFEYATSRIFLFPATPICQTSRYAM
jgi:hypothetical protein